MRVVNWSLGGCFVRGGGWGKKKSTFVESNGAQNLVAKNPSNKLKAPEHPNPRARTRESIPCHDT